MAIVNKTDSDYGFTFDKCYLKIDDILIKPNHNEVRIDLRGYADISAREKLTEWEENKSKLTLLRKDPESKDSDIQELENLTAKKPIGVYRDRIEITFDEFISFVETFDLDGLKTAGYLYIKTLDTYKESTDK